MTKRGLEVSRCAVTFCWQQANSLDKEQEYIYAILEPQKPAAFAAAPIPPLTRQAIAKGTKAKAGSNTSQASPVISAVMVRSGTVIRARVLKRDKGLCQLCLRAGVVREAKTVDHIIPKAHGGTDADSNLQSLCWPCHKAKTARERLK